MLEILLESALRSFLIAAAAGTAMTCLRVRAAAVRHCVWTVVLLAMLLLPVAIAWGPEISFRVLPATPPARAPASMLAIETLLRNSTAVETADVPRQQRSSTAPIAPESTTSRVAPAPGRWAQLLIALYAAGAAVLLVRLVVGTLYVRKLVRASRMRGGHLTSASVTTPVTVGGVRPIVILPEGWEAWPTALLQTVLEHERAHVRRRDPLVQWLALLNRAAFWFNPLAWWLERRLRALAEEACDASVLERGQAPVAYSECLLGLARSARPMRALPGGLGMASPGCALQRRIRKILDSGLQTASPVRIGSAAAICALLSAGLASVTLAQQAAPPAESQTPLDEYWIDEDEWRFEVQPLITPGEEKEYAALRSVEQRHSFIEAFWARRDPTPGTPLNEWRTEYESRVDYARTQFAERPYSYGYLTTRGLLYVVLGPPDSVEVPNEDGGPYEYWRYGPLAELEEEFVFRISDPQAERAWHCAYDLVSPAPTETFEGDVALGPDAARRIVVKTYPRGFVTYSIPADFARTRSTSTRLVAETEDPEEAAAAQPEPGLGKSVRFELNLAGPLTQEAASSSYAFFGRNGLLCTHLLRPGEYRLTAEVELTTGARLADAVVFEVAERSWAWARPSTSLSTRP